TGPASGASSVFEQGRELRAGIGVARSAGPIERLLGALQVRLDAGSARQGHPIDITADRRTEIAAAAIEVEVSRRALDDPRLSLEGQVAERDAAEADLALAAEPVEPRRLREIRGDPVAVLVHRPRAHAGRGHLRPAGLLEQRQGAGVVGGLLLVGE